MLLNTNGLMKNSLNINKKGENIHEKYLSRFNWLSTCVGIDWL